MGKGAEARWEEEPASPTGNPVSAHELGAACSAASPAPAKPPEEDVKGFALQSQSWRSPASGRHSGPRPPRRGPPRACTRAPEPLPVPLLPASVAPWSRPAAHQGPRKVRRRPRLRGFRGPDLANAGGRSGSGPAELPTQAQTLPGRPRARPCPPPGLSFSMCQMGVRLVPQLPGSALQQRERHRDEVTRLPDACSRDSCPCPRWLSFLVPPGSSLR